MIEQNQGSIDLSYRLTAHDSISFSGSESLQKYIRGASGLWNSYTYSGGVFYQHLFNPNLAAGFGYNYSALDFGHGQSRAGVQMFEAFAMYKFSPAFSVSGWVGPQLTNTKDLIPIFCSPYGCLIEEMHNSQWNVAEGATVSYYKGSNSVRARFQPSCSRWRRRAGSNGDVAGNGRLCPSDLETLGILVCSDVQQQRLHLAHSSQSILGCCAGDDELHS